MNAEEFGKKIAAAMKAREEKYAADVAALRARIEVLQEMVKTVPEAMAKALPVLPGPPGEKGEPGADGKDGTVNIDDIEIEYDGERTFKILGKSFRIPVPIHRGVFGHGGHYDSEDMVTAGGSEWICKKAGTNRRPGDGSADWQLIVKAGRDGKHYRGHDGKEASTA